MIKIKKGLVSLVLLICSFGLFWGHPNKVSAGELNFVAMEQTANYLFLADKNAGKIYVFNNDGSGSLNKIITVGNSPASMVIYDNYLLVALSQVKKIKVINKDTLAEVGEIATPKMPYWLALDGDKLHATVSGNNGSNYYPFVLDMVIQDNTVVASATTIWPTTYPDFSMSGNEQIIISPVTHAAYIGNLGYSPDNIKKYDVTDINNIQYLLQNDHGSLGSNGQQFVFNKDYSKIYFSASGSNGYTTQIVSPSNLSKIADLPSGAYPNSVVSDANYVYAGKSASYYDAGDIKVYNESNNVFVKSYDLSNYENLVSRGISSGVNLYAASNKYLYLLDKNSSKVTKIYDFVNDKIVDNTLKNGDLLKTENSNMIYQFNNGKRDVVPFLVGYEGYKTAVMSSRGLQETDAKIISSSDMASYPVGKNITIKPGNNYLLKQQSQEKYYIVSSEGGLTEINNSAYQYSRVTIPDAFLSNYTIIKMESKPDFIVSDIVYYKNYEGNANVASVKVCNTGSSYTFDSTGLKVEIGLNGVYSNWVRNNGGETMASGACKEFFPALKLLVGSGPFNVSARIDGESQISESNENNNTLNKVVSISSSAEIKPDFMVSDIIYYKYREGKENIVSARVCNYGNPYTFDASGLKIEFGLDGDYSTWVRNNGGETMPSGTCKEFFPGVKLLIGSGPFNVSVRVDGEGQISEANENNNITSKKISITSEDGTSKTDVKAEDSTNKTEIKPSLAESIYDRAKNLFQNNIEQILTEVKELRNMVKEQQNQIKYLTTLKKDVEILSANAEKALNNFITYGIDDNTKKLGEGERAAVIYSYKSAFSKLPETEGELSDMIKIASGRWPSVTNDEAEKKAKEQFQKIYKRIADMNNANDNAAVTVMAYGLRQKAENRNLASEKNGIKSFKYIYGHNPVTTDDWNIMQAITYSGASRGIDTDGDLLIDTREAELGTDPKNKDTDGDGYLDGVEVANGFDPLKK
jgi:hypothetical protein